jgi:type IV pilus assembly protein PilC
MKIEATILNKSNLKPPDKNEKVGKSIWNKDISLSFLKNDNAFKSHFYSEMSVLAGSGMDIRRSLEIISKGSTKQKEIEITDKIRQSIIDGSSLSDALDATGKFSLYDVSSVKIGEESGALSEVLSELAVYYAKKISQRRQITGALTYPMMVLLTTVVSLIFMLNYIVPMFEDVFKRFKGTLPPLTRSIIRLSDSFMTYAWIALLLIAGIAFICYYSRKEEWYRRLSSKFVLSLPVVKDVVSLTYKVRYCQTMRLLISSRVHLLDAIGLLEKIIGFYPLEKALKEIKVRIASGTSLAEAMEQYPFFDRKMIAMTQVAEEVNKLDVLYDQLFKQYSEELDVKIKTMNSLLEPIMIILVGGLVGIILISMYMPIFQLGTNIGV